MRRMILTRERLHRLRLTVFALFWPALLILVAGSLIPLAAPPLDLGMAYEDLLLHFGGYAAIGGMAGSSLHRRSSAVRAAACLIAVGALLEILQGYTGRDPSLYDAIANTAGASFGCLLGRALVEPLYRRYGSETNPGDVMQ
jgi:VanZ family protein